MTLLHKKLLGIGLVLVGGLMAVHGASVAATWETVTGLIVLLAGAALLALKVVRRNLPDSTRAQW